VGILSGNLDIGSCKRGSHTGYSQENRRDNTFNIGVGRERRGQFLHKSD